MKKKGELCLSLIHIFTVDRPLGSYPPEYKDMYCLLYTSDVYKRQVLLNKKNGLMTNIFTDSDVCELGVTFMASGRKFSYDFKMCIRDSNYCGGVR